MALTFAAIILAAGQSRRMGRPKLLLPWGDTSILGHLLSEWQAVGARIISVVYDAADPGIPNEISRLGYDVALLKNLQPAHGMLSSVVCGARWALAQLELSHAVVVLGDQPQLRRSTLVGLIDFADRHADLICQPKIGSRRAHPVVLPRPALKELSGTRAPTLKAFLSGSRRAEWPCHDAGLNLDIDRPEDYARALKLAAAPITTQ